MSTVNTSSRVGIGNGMLLAAANVAVIAGVVMTRNSGAAIFVALIGGVLGVIAGGVIGGLARILRPCSPWTRSALLVVLAELVVVVLGGLFYSPPHRPLPREEWLDVMMVAVISTFIAALTLERWTRGEPSDLPVARALPD